MIRILISLPFLNFGLRKINKIMSEINSFVELPSDHMRFFAKLAGFNVKKHEKSCLSTIIGQVVGPKFIFPVGDDEVLGTGGIECEIIIIPKRRLTPDLKNESGCRVTYGNVLDIASSMFDNQAWNETKEDK